MLFEVIAELVGGRRLLLFSVLPKQTDDADDYQTELTEVRKSNHKHHRVAARAHGCASPQAVLLA